MSIVLVTGGRDYKDRDMVFSTLDMEHDVERIKMLVEGGARGADRFAREWAQSRGVPWATVPANWDYYGKVAGPIRNESMLVLRPDRAIAFPGGTGTADMVTRLEAAGVDILQVH